jgi:hypothetical protein
MDVTSLFSGIMIGAGLGLAFCTAIIYAHHREAITEKEVSVLFEPKLPEELKDEAKEDLREARKAKQ